VAGRVGSGRVGSGRVGSGMAYSPSAGGAGQEGCPEVLIWRVCGILHNSHTYAALLIAEAAHPRAIMERLGHSSIQVTLGTYGYLFPTLDQALTSRLLARITMAQQGRSGTDMARRLPSRAPPHQT